MALLYVEAMKTADKFSDVDAIAARYKIRYNNNLIKILIKAMSKGYISSRESKAIKYLRNL